MYIPYIDIYKHEETLQMIYFPCDLLAMCNPELNEMFDEEHQSEAAESPVPCSD